MALTISATNSELPLPVNNMLMSTFLRNAASRAPYFLGTMPGEITRNGGTATVKWRRIDNLSAATTALGELQGNASYMQGRSSAALAVTDVTATVAKYGNFVIMNETVDKFEPQGQFDAIMKVIGINAGQSLNQVQRNTAEDSQTIVRVAGASDGAVNSKITIASIKSVINTLTKNSARTFFPMTNGSQNVGTGPQLPAFIGICHPDVAIDVAGLTGFTSVETYAGQVATYLGEFGSIGVAGLAVRFCLTEDASVDANAGAAVGSTGCRSTGGSTIDLYSVPIYGMDAIGTVGFGQRYPDGSFMAGDDLGPVDIIVKGLGSGGTSDPYDEITTVAWKAWHASAVLNAAFGRTIRCGASTL